MIDPPTYTAPQDRAISLDRYDPTSPYHPHDVQILKYFPNEDLPSLSYAKHKSLYHLAVNLEKLGIPPPSVPWPSPPPRSHDELEAGVEDWRKSALEAIDERLALLDQRQKTPTRYLQNAPLAKRSRTGLPHRALVIPELLEHILRFAAPSTQCAAWYVSHSWRLTIEHIWIQQHSPQPCEAVEYGQASDVSLRWLPAAKEDVTELERRAALLPQNPHWGVPAPFIPARLTQDPSILDATYHTIQAWYDHRFHGAELPSRAIGPRWLDFSQFRFNPHFLNLLHNRVRFKFGRCEIELQHGTPDMFSYPLPVDTFKATIGGMFLTEPPCRTLGLYTPTYRSTAQSLHPLVRIHNTDGIRVHQFLAALQGHSVEVYGIWRDMANELRQKTADSDWTKFTTTYWRHSMWDVPGSPRFVVLLETMNGSKPTLAHAAFGQCEYMHDVCEKEWYQDIASA